MRAEREENMTAGEHAEWERRAEGSNSASAAGCTESGPSVEEVVYITPKDLTEEELQYFTEIIEPILKGHMVERRITLPKF